MAEVGVESLSSKIEENIHQEDEKVLKETFDSGILASSLFLVIAEPLNVEQKDLILERIVTELSNWDSELSVCDLSQHLQAVKNFQNFGQGKICKTVLEDLQITIVINGGLEDVTNELHNFMLTPSKYKFLLHSGPVFMNSGAWLLNDGVFTFQNFCHVLKNHSVLEALVKPPETLLDLSFIKIANEWNDAAFSKINPKLKIRLTRPPRTLNDESSLIKFSDQISNFLSTPSINDRLPSASPTGTITFDQPTAYIFPAGQGDSLLFGVADFTILIDGGYSKSSCFYNLVRHLARLDVVLMTRLGAENVFGLSSFFEKQALEKQKPCIGTVMLNIGDARHKVTTEGSDQTRTTSGLVVSLAEEGRLMAEHLSILNLTPSVGLGFSFTNLYYKVGHGSLDMYVISPYLDSKEYKDFITHWSKAVDSYKGGIPVSDNLSISCVMLWKPAPRLKEPVVRALIPGRIQLAKLTEGLDKLKNVISFQTHTGLEKAPIKKLASSAKQTAGSKLNSRKENSFTKAPSSASIERTAKKTSSDLKKPLTKKPLATKSLAKPEDIKDGEKTKASKVSDAKNLKKADEQKTNAKISQKPSTKPSKAPSFIEKKEKVSTNTKETDKQAPKKTSKPLQTKTPPHSKDALKTDKKVLDKTKITKSAEKKKVLDKSKTADKKEISNEEKLEKKEIPTPTDSPSKNEGYESKAKTEKNVDEKRVNELVDGVAAVTIDGNSLGEPLKDALSDKEREKIDEDKEVEECKSNTIPLQPEFDPSKEWGEPLSLPSPAKEILEDKISVKNARKPVLHEDMKSGPKKEVKKSLLKPVTPFYVDLAYIPLNADLDFFRKVRARYYVLSAAAPDPQILPHLLEARETWEEPMEWDVHVIPTHQSQALLSWLASLNDRLIASSIKITPPASRCSVAIKEPDLACDAYRIPFN